MKKKSRLRVERLECRRLLSINTPLEPLGSLAYQELLNGSISVPGEQDSFTFSVDAGQSLSVAVTPTAGGSLAPAVRLVDPSGTTLALNFASTGAAALFNSAPAIAAGTYTLMVEGTSGSLGAYAVRALLNAAFEAESFAGPSNSTAATAESVDGAFTTLGVDTASRAAIVGRGATSPNFTATRGVTSGVFAPNVIPLTFTAVPTSVGPATITVRANADLGDSSEFLTIAAEGIFTTNVFVNDGGEGTAATTQFTIDAATLAQLTADGTLSFTVTPSINVNDFGFSTLDLDLSYPVLGASGDDWYRFTLDDGESASIAMDVQPASVAGAILEFYSGDGATLIARGDAGPTADRLLNGFVDATTDGAPTEYLVRVVTADEYTLLLTVDALFHVEPNNTLAQAQPLTGRRVALGAVSIGSAGQIDPPGPPVPLIQLLSDGDGFNWDIDGTGAIGDGSSDAYDGGLVLSGFGGSSTAATEAGGRELVIGPSPVGAFSATRKIYVSPTEGFARFIESFTNNGSSTQTQTVTVLTNLGSDGSTVLVSTSSGDNSFTVADDWIVTDDFNGGGDPTLAHVIGGDGQRPSAVSYTVGNLSFSYSLTLAPGETKSILHFASQATNQASALATADDLRALRLGALTAITGTELSQIVNYRFVVEDPDFYSFNAVAGDTIGVVAKAPSSGPLDFPNRLDPAIEVTAPSGAIVPHTLGAGDELLSFVAAETGRYVVRVSGQGTSTGGEYVLGVTGADRQLTPFSVATTSPVDGASFNAASAPTTFVVNLSSPVNLSTVDAADLTIQSGRITVPATSVTVVDSDTLSFALPALPNGPSTISLGSGALVSLGGQSLEAFTATLTIDSVSPRVTGSSVAPNGIVGAAPFRYTATFNEALLPASVSASQVLITYSSRRTFAPTAVSLSASGRELLVDVPSLPEGGYTIALLSGASGLRDAAGNPLDGEAPTGPLPPGVSGDGAPGGDFLLPLNVEAGPTAFPAPLTAVAPLGSLTHRGEVSGSIVSAADIDRYTLNVDPRQAVTVIVRPATGLRAALGVSFAGNPLTATSQGSVEGETVLLRNLPTLTGGELRIEVQGVGGSVGAYTLEVLLNADMELARVGLPGGDSQATAQDLAPAFTPLGTIGAERASVVGSLQGSGGAFTTSQTVSGGVFTPNVLPVQFTALPTPQGAGTLRVSAIADLDSTSEFLTLSLEGLFTTNLFVSGGLQGSLVSTTVDLPQALLTQLTADGVLNATITPSSSVNNLSFTTSVTLELSYDAGTLSGDWYRFSLDDGVPATVAVDGGAEVELYNAAGELLATGGDNLGTLTGIDRFTHRSATADPADYFLRVFGQSGAYQLLVTRGATFDLEPNDGAGLLQRLIGGALGHVDSGDGGAPGAPTSIEVLQTFAGPPATGSIPPDPIAAAGPAQLVAMVNTDIAIYDKATGAQLFRQSMDGPGGFFGSVGATTTIFDPWVLYDTSVNRFFAIAIDIVGTSQSNVYLAVSTTSTPTSSSDWHKYKLNFTDNPTGNLGSGAHFPDYPKLGVSENAIWISGNYFPINTGSGVYAGITGYDKASLLNGGPANQIYRETFAGFSVMPMTQYGAAGAQYFAEADTSGGSTLRVHAISGPPGQLTRTVSTISVPAFLAPPDIPELGGGQPVDSIDSRVLTGVWRNGSMWFAHGIADPAAGDGEALVRWYEVRTNNFPAGGAPTLVQSGNVDPGPGLHAWIPAVAVDGAGNLGIGFALGGPGIYYGAGYTARLAGDAPGATIQPVVQYVAGLGPYELIGGTRNRWGDYSAISVDPSDDSTFWAFNQYATANNNWATQFASFQVERPVDEDQYVFSATAGDILRIEARSLAAGPGEFVNSLDVDLTLVGPGGVAIPYSNRTGDELLFAAAPATGEYTLVVRGAASAGTYFVQVERPTGVEPSVSVVGANPLAGARVAQFPTTITLNFSEQLLVNSVQASDLVIGGVAATAVQRVDADTYTFTIDPSVRGGDGAYTVVLAAGVVLDLQQQGNSEYSTTFTFDTTGPRVVDILLNNAPLRFSRVYAEGEVVFKAVFDEPLLELESPRRGPYAPGTTDIVVRELASGVSTFATAVSYDTATRTLTATFAPFAEGDYTLTLISGDGAFEDVVGNNLDGEPLGPGLDGTTSGNGAAGGDYVVGFTVDRSSSATPPFTPIEPLGGLVYSSGVLPGLVNVGGDQDVFEFFVAAGQTLSAIARPTDAAATLGVELIGVASRATSPTPGAPAAFSAVALPFDAVYEVRVTGDRKTAYQLELLLNAATEEAAIGTGDSALTVLDGSRFNVLPSVSSEVTRWAALGRSDAVPNNGNLITNGGFETGNFLGWSAVATGSAFSAWQVTRGGTSTWSTFALTAPQEGLYSAVNGFDGGGPMEFRLDQVVSLPNTTSPLRLTWADRAQWDYSQGIPATIARESIVEALDPTTELVLASLSAFSTGPESDFNQFGDTGWVQRSADLSSLAGRDVKLRFRQVVTQNFSGPGQYEIDDIRIAPVGVVTGADLDSYTLDLSSYAGQTVEVALASRSGRSLASSVIQLVDALGAVVATSSPSALLGGAAINGFVVPATAGLYSMVVTSVDPGDYTLLVTAGGVVEREPNNSPSAAGVQSLASSGALGYLAAGDTDVSRLPLSAGQQVLVGIEAVLPRSLDGLSLRARLLSPSGTVLSESILAAGGEAELFATAPSTGDYQLELTRLSGEGEYVVSTQRSGLRGDYNRDGLVDAADYSAWRDMVGAPGPASLADGDQDGDVDDADGALWRANYGLTAATASAADWLTLRPTSVSLVLAAADPLPTAEFVAATTPIVPTFFLAPTGFLAPEDDASSASVTGLVGPLLVDPATHEAGPTSAYLPLAVLEPAGTTTGSRRSGLFDFPTYDEHDRLRANLLLDAALAYEVSGWAPMGPEPIDLLGSDDGFEGEVFGPEQEDYDEALAMLTSERWSLLE